MDRNKVGGAIAYLRKRAGYTQKDLADRIGVSDKAVSKWERGLSLPDIAYLRKLSILLDTDTDSLLAGDAAHHRGNWRGVVLLEENINRIGADTVIYDKPLVDFLLSYFLLVGIREVLIVCTLREKTFIDETLGDGSAYGIRLSCHAGTLAQALTAFPSDAQSVMLVYGRCLLYGVDQTRFFQRAMAERDRLTLMATPKKWEASAARLAKDAEGKVVDADSADSLRTQYDYSVVPMLFCPARQLPEIAGASSVSAFVAARAARNEAYVEMLDRGFVEFEVDSWSDVTEASTFMRIIQERCGMNVYCLEEVAWRRGMISLEQLRRHGERQSGTERGGYILSLYRRFRARPYIEPLEGERPAGVNEQSVAN